MRPDGPDIVCHRAGPEHRRLAGPAHKGNHDQCEPCPARHCLLGRPKCDLHATPVCQPCVGTVRTDLADIGGLTAGLPDQALNGSGGGHLLAAAPIPGGDATVMLGPGSNHGTYAALESVADPVPPLLILATWDDDWRDVLGDPPDRRTATIERSVAYLMRNLNAAANGNPGTGTHPHPAFDEFAGEMRALRQRLEAVLCAGERDHLGAKIACLEIDCPGVLRQTYIDGKPCRHSTRARRDLAAWLTYGEPTRRWQLLAALEPCGRTACDQGGRRSVWSCPVCDRRYTEAEYRRAVAQAGAEADPIKPGVDIARSLGIPYDRLRKWGIRGEITRLGRDARGRNLYDRREVRRHAMLRGIAS